jgi:hypothetical protein
MQLCLRLDIHHPLPAHEALPALDQHALLIPADDLPESPLRSSAATRGMARSVSSGEDVLAMSPS